MQANIERDLRSPLLVTVVGAAILAFLFHFNSQPHGSPNGYNEYIVTNIVLLLWLPLLLVVLILRKDLSEFGMTPGDTKWGYRIVGLLFLVALPGFLFAARLPQFQNYYPIWKEAATDPVFLRYYELTYGMYLFCWEFFFRGFLLFGLTKWFRPGIAVVIQAIAFGIMHLGKPGPEVAASFATGIVLGIVALRSRSFMPCFLVHWASATTFDLLIIMAGKGRLF